MIPKGSGKLWVKHQASRSSDSGGGSMWDKFMTTRLPSLRKAGIGDQSDYKDFSGRSKVISDMKSNCDLFKKSLINACAGWNLCYTP